ncbi:MAG: ATP-binding protein [Thermoplasmata archaeon]|nr:ATP-binding protein [Thermoplasmata archaeon]
MRKFVGRANELRFLETIYAESDHKTCAVTGRRQIGKSSLLRKFCEGKRSFMVQFYNGSEEQNVEMLSLELSSFLGTDIKLDSFAAAVKQLMSITEEEKTVVVFDEYTYASASSPYIASGVQELTDWIVDRTESMIILCSSEMSTLEDEIDTYGMPLYGRFPARLKVGPLDLRETLGFHPEMEHMDALRLYLTLGGIPVYHSLANKDTYRGNIESCYLSQPALLSNEAMSIVNRELNDGDKYTRILDAIGNGATTIATIASKCDVSEQLAGMYLAHLSSIGVVKPLVPMAGANRREKRYAITDYLVSFYYGVIMRRENLIRNREAECYDDILPTISTQLGKSFEFLCRDFVGKAYGCDEVGSWWGTVESVSEDGIKEAVDADIDVVATKSSGKNRIDLFGECKFRTRKMGMSDLRTLESRVENLHGRFNPRLILFSASGFDEDLTEYAADSGMLLIDADVLFGDKPVPPL